MEINFYTNNFYSDVNYTMNVNKNDHLLTKQFTLVTNDEQESKIKAIKILKEDYNIDYDINLIEFERLAISDSLPTKEEVFLQFKNYLKSNIERVNRIHQDKLKESIETINDITELEKFAQNLDNLIGVNIKNENERTIR